MLKAVKYRDNMLHALEVELKQCDDVTILLDKADVLYKLIHRITEVGTWHS
jgi:hypothetical protein